MNCIRLTNERLEDLRDFLGQKADAHLFALGILEDHGLRNTDGAPVKAYALSEDGKSFETVAIVGGDGGLTLPIAKNAAAAEELGQALRGKMAVRSLFGPRRILDGFLKGLGAQDSVLLVRPLTVFAAAADFLGPFVCPELRRAAASDLPRLIPFAARAVEESLGENPLVCTREAFERRIAARVLAGRCYILEKDGALALKLDVTSQSRFGLEIEGVYVAPKLRQHGLATLAVGQITRHMLGRMPKIVARVPEGDEPATRLCRRVGFLPVRRNDETRLMILR